jgi:hypothetical protein
MDKPGFVCKLYTVSYDTYVQPVLKGHHFCRVFATNIFDIDVAGLMAGGEVILCVLHVVDQKKVHRMCFRYSGFDHGFAIGYVHIGPRQTIFDLPMSDGRQSQGSRVFFFLRSHKLSYGDVDFVEGITVRDDCILLRRQIVSAKRLRTARPLNLRHYGNHLSSIPVGFLEICSKPSH